MQSNLMTLMTEFKSMKKRVGITKKPDSSGFNISFFTHENMLWFDQVILNWLPPRDKHLVFLPCGSAEKTRGKVRNGVVDERKFISEGLGHNLLKPIREDETLEKVILSEPCTMIPYALESHPLRKDYDLPVSELCIQGENTFINQLALWLLKLKQSQPERNFVYYVGGCHHFLILHYANKRAGDPFRIVQEIPPRGLRDYTSSAAKMDQVIHDLEDRGIVPQLQPVHEIAMKFLKARGRYTHRKFWKSVITLRLINDPDIEPCIELWGKNFKEEEVKIAAESDVGGFVDLYEPVPVQESEVLDGEA